MAQMEKIAWIENEVEALCLKGELEQRGIPCMMQSHHDLAYDGLFQSASCWGHVAAPAEHKNKILALLEALRQRPSREGDETDGDPAGGDLD